MVWCICRFGQLYEDFQPLNTGSMATGEIIVIPYHFNLNLRLGVIVDRLDVSSMLDSRINRCVASLHAAVAGVVSTRALFSEEPFKSFTLALLTLDTEVVLSTNFFEGRSSTLASLLPFTLGYMLYDCVVMCIDAEVYMPLMVHLTISRL